MAVWPDVPATQTALGTQANGFAPLPAVLETAMLLLHHTHVRGAGNSGKTAPAQAKPIQA